MSADTDRQQEGPEQLADKELAAPMRAAYDAIGADDEHCDGVILLPAQSEVVTRDPA